MKRAFLIIILAILCAPVSNAQKVKYKDLYLMLEAKKYDEAEPFLKSFLSSSKNADHPNGNFQMALMYHQRSYQNDVLLDDSTLIINVDSALLYYDRALKFITDKEVRRNDEYYRAYQRRDIRTGKFGIKLADVQFDIEKRQKSLYSRKEKVKELAKYYESTSDGYNKAFQIFADTRSQYKTEKVLYLQGSGELNETLGELENIFTKVIQDFNKYKTTLGKIPKSGYDPSLQLREILNYTKDGTTPSDLSADNVDLWDFGKWAENVREKIKTQIYPMKEKIIAFDQELNNIEKSMKSDSVPMADQIKPISSLKNELKEWDDDPLPLNIFNLKMSGLEYLSHQMQHKQYADSSDISYRAQVVNYSIDQLQKIDSLANVLLGVNIVEEGKNYSQFVTRQYNNAEGIEAYVKSQVDFAVETRKIKELELVGIEDRMNWLIDEMDSIPVFIVEDTTAHPFQPILIEENLTTGLRKKADNHVEGYFTKITGERSTETKTFFKVNEQVFNFSNLKNLQSKVVDDGEGDIFYVLMYNSVPVDSNYVANLSKIYSSDGLAWEKEILLEALPKNLVIDESTGDIIIAHDLENFSGDISSIEKKLVVDKKGNVVK